MPEKTLILTLLLILLFGCAPDPRNQADAYSTKLRAHAEAERQAQQRAQDAELWQIRRREMESQSPAWVEASTGLIRVGLGALSLSIAITLLAAATGAALSFIGIGAAHWRRAWLQAHTLVADRETGQFPAILTKLGHGRYTLADPNTGMVLQLDVRSPAESQMVSAAFASRLNASAAYHARMAGKHAEGVALVGTHPVIVTGGSDGE